jgi:hypothetical protein
MRNMLVVGMIILAIPGAAQAGAKKPTAAQAKKAATAWLTALTVGDNAPDAKALTGLTAAPFVFAADRNEDVACKVTTAASADKLDDATDCLKGVLDQGIAKVKLKPYQKGDMGSQREDRVKAIAGVKDATVVLGFTPCAGSNQSVVVAVVMDGATPKVAGVFAVVEDCGE